jgi:hypothetical protein
MQFFPSRLIDVPDRYYEVGLYAPNGFRGESYSFVAKIGAITPTAASNPFTFLPPACDLRHIRAATGCVTFISAVAR